MKYKLAAVKIHMIGSPAIILGFCRYDDDDAFWEARQLFTHEDLLGNPNFKQDWIIKILKKYRGDTIHFTSINKTLKVLQKEHDFNFEECEPLEITKAEWELLGKELSDDDWMAFDDETWGK